jgi:hypothetical protein
MQTSAQTASSSAVKAAAAGAEDSSDESDEEDTAAGNAYSYITLYNYSEQCVHACSYTHGSVMYHIMCIYCAVKASTCCLFLI